MNRAFIILFLPFLAGVVLSQNADADSIRKEFKKAKHDTTLAFINICLGEALYLSNPEVAAESWKQTKFICEDNLKQSLSPILKKTYRNYLGTSLQCLGMTFQDKGNIKEALTYFFNALKLKEEAGVVQGMANANLCIGSVYAALENKNKALQYYSQALKQYEKISDLEGVAAANNNIGTVYFDVHNVDSASYYFKKTLLITEQIGDHAGTAYSLGAIGTTFEKTDPAKALEYYMKSFKLHEEINNKYGLSLILNNIGSAYYKQGKFQEAEGAYKRALSISREIDYPENIRNAAKELAGLYKKQKNGMKALEMFELYIGMRDTINSNEIRKAGIQKDLEHQYEKKTAADSVLHAQEIIQKQIIHEEAIKQQRIYTYSGGVGFVLMLVIAVISFRAFKNKQKANEIISEQKMMVEGQKHMIEEKQKEIIDSIMYARRIQRSLLANEKHMQKTITRLKDKNT